MICQLGPYLMPVRHARERARRRLVAFTPNGFKSFKGSTIQEGKHTSLKMQELFQVRLMYKDSRLELVAKKFARP